jgi:predicted SAM-dependent methyltransferase
MKIHLGCGDTILPGFINIDMIDKVQEGYLRWDLLKPLPDYIQNVELVCHEHALEHFTADEGLALLKRCRERMIPGGKMLMALPDFRRLVTHYLNNNWDFFNRPGVICYAPNHQMLEIINFSLYQFGEHKCMYDAEYACFILEQAGFKNAKEIEFTPGINLEPRRDYTFYVSGES